MSGLPVLCSHKTDTVHNHMSIICRDIYTGQDYWPCRNIKSICRNIKSIRAPWPGTPYWPWVTLPDYTPPLLKTHGWTAPRVDSSCVFHGREVLSQVREFMVLNTRSWSDSMKCSNWLKFIRISRDRLFNMVFNLAYPIYRLFYKYIHGYIGHYIDGSSWPINS